MPTPEQLQQAEKEIRKEKYVGSREWKRLSPQGREKLLLTYLISKHAQLTAARDEIERLKNQLEIEMGNFNNFVGMQITRRMGLAVLGAERFIVGGFDEIKQHISECEKSPHYSALTSLRERAARQADYYAKNSGTTRIIVAAIRSMPLTEKEIRGDM